MPSRMKHPEPPPALPIPSGASSLSLGFSSAPWESGCSYHITVLEGLKKILVFQGFSKALSSGTHWGVSESYSQP